MGVVGGAVIAARLRELGAYLRLFGESPYRARAYETGASALEALGTRWRALLEEGRLTEVPGIGERLAATIRELADTGTTATLEKFRAELPPGLLSLVDLPGITVARIRVLHDELGVTDRAGLLHAAETGLLANVRGFGPRSVTKLIAAMNRPPPPPAELLLLEAREQAARWLPVLREAPGVTVAEVAGAIRRWKEVVDGVRLVAAAADPGAALAAFVAATPLGEVTERREEADGVRAVFRVPGGVTGQVLVVPPESFVLALLRETGSAAHVEALGARAERLGVTLEELAARHRHGGDDPAAGEARLYAALDLPWLPPELREELADLDAASAGDDFADLVSISDISGYVHCHTTASDGRHDLVDMARAAHAHGMQFLTVTDHSPTASYAGGLSAERLGEQAAEVAAVAREVGIDVLRGTESDIRADGTLDYETEVLEHLDVVIASIHNRFGMDEARMTERLVRAMKQPVYKIWGHGLGRLLLRRDPIACRVEEVLDAAAAGRAAIEINGDPHRMDLEPRWLRRARARGLRFVVSVDAHSVRDYDNLVYGVHLARRAGIRRHEILNTRPAAAFRAAVHPARAGK